MKRKIILILLICIFLLTGCQSKSTLNGEGFTDAMEKNEYKLEETTTSTKLQNSTIEESYKATHPSRPFNIDFYIFDSESSAQTQYAKIKESIGLTGATLTTDINLGNYSKIAALGKDDFTFVSRVSNTIAYCKAEKVYSEEIKRTFLEIGY